MHGSLRAQGATMIDEVALDLLKGIVAESKDKPRSEVFDQFELVLRKNGPAQREVNWYFFLNMVTYLTTERTKRVPMQERVERALQVKAIAESIKAQILLMKLVLPSGKLVEVATFAELAVAGGIYAKWSKLGKPNQVVGKTVTEAQLKKATR